MGERGIAVRNARPEDTEAIALVHTRTWQTAYEHVFGADLLATLSVEERTARWRDILDGKRDPTQANFVCEQGGKVVGFASVGASRDTDARAADGELYGIYVLPAAWGSGAGAALMDAAVDALHSSGFREASLWVLDDNPRARRFYEKMGWSLDGLERQGTHLGVDTAEVRYRVALEGQ